MRDFAFYNAGVDDAKGPRRVFGLARRLLRRILRPMFFRQEAIYRDLQDQIDQLSAQVDALSRRVATSDAFGWDYVAMARRLAAIEDRLASSPTTTPTSAPAPAEPSPVRRPGRADGLPSPHVGERSPSRATAVRP
ncbi:hypothetical protein [Tautonia sociabilis]|uniref:Uncharacterized protein n=1 Tax=Tautonia sociabilis TaxID=2080755 RepID=A0A432MNQ3_9BACT|nr:hypothetical protein [Tautonia sociabilis]RUL89064.1 hypothetical protein TsocGM_04210 [Tautonia sociabilis]